MRLLDRLLHRERGGHDKWLKEHPGKGAMSMPPPPNASYDQGTRERMEHEMDEQRTKNHGGTSE